MTKTEVDTIITYRRKNLGCYLNLNYRVIIEELQEEDGGGFEAYIKEFGRYTCNGYGETPEEAYQDVMDYKEELIERWYGEDKIEKLKGGII